MLMMITMTMVVLVMISRKEVGVGDVEEEGDCEGQAPRADVLFKRRPPPRWIHGHQVSPSSSLSSLSGCR